MSFFAQNTSILPSFFRRGSVLPRGGDVLPKGGASLPRGKASGVLPGGRAFLASVEPTLRPVLEGLLDELEQGGAVVDAETELLAAEPAPAPAPAAAEAAPAPDVAPVVPAVARAQVEEGPRLMSGSPRRFAQFTPRVKGKPAQRAVAEEEQQEAQLDKPPGLLTAQGQVVPLQSLNTTAVEVSPETQTEPPAPETEGEAETAPQVISTDGLNEFETSVIDFVKDRPRATGRGRRYGIVQDSKVHLFASKAAAARFLGLNDRTSTLDPSKGKGNNGLFKTVKRSGGARVVVFTMTNETAVAARAKYGEGTPGGASAASPAPTVTRGKKEPEIEAPREVSRRVF